MTLRIYLLSLPEVGYLQGINYIAGCFLIYMDVETTVLSLISIMKEYKLDVLFANVENIGKYTFILLFLLGKYFPKIKNNIQKSGIDVIYFIQLTFICTGWFLTFFLQVLPLETVFRIIDIYLIEPEKILYRISLAIFKSLEKQLLEAEDSFEKIYYCFKNLNINPDMEQSKLIKSALQFTFSRKLINQLEEKYYQNNKYIINQLNIQKLDYKDIEVPDIPNEF